MTQGYPPPSPPGLGYRSPGGDPLGPARTASILMFVLGGLISLAGVANTAGAFTFSGEELLQQQQQMQPHPSPDVPQLQLSPRAVKVMVLGAGVLELVVGLGMMVLATPVRRGNRRAMVAAIVVVSIVGAFSLLAAVFALIGTLLAPAMAALLCVMIVPLALSAVLLLRLIQARRVLGPAMAPGSPGYAPQAGYGGGWPAPPPGYGPGPVAPGGPPPAASSPSYPPSFSAPPPPGPYSGPSPFGASFAPMGPVRYGYAQAPSVPAPPPGDTPIVPAPLVPAPAAAPQSPSSSESSGTTPPPGASGAPANPGSNEG